MKLNNKGFALTGIIYMLIVLFLLVLLLILANLAERKVVLDKIKYDVKQKLNQGGIISETTNKNSYIISFEPLGGQIDETIRTVKYGRQYGELPIPKKNGYKFKGWTGKNIFKEFKNGIKINTTTGEEEINNKAVSSDFIRVNFEYSYYYLSGLTDSLKSTVSFYNDKVEYMGSTTEFELTSLKITDSIIDPTTTTEAQGEIAFIRISQYEDENTTGTINDINNLNVQFEYGENATSYEPYKEYTKSTYLTKEEDHTLYAIWEQNGKNIYQDINYVKTNGNQYIILDYIAKQTTEIKLDIELIENSNTSLENANNDIIGLETTTTDNRFNANFGQTSEQVKTIFYWTDKITENEEQIKSQIYDSVTSRSIMDIKSGVVTYQELTTETLEKTGNNTDNTVLFGNYNGTDDINAFNRYDIKIYKIELYEGETLKKSLIPVKNKLNKKIGLYDEISDELYESDTSTSFLES
jgi:uncharacterized repeat protein (TIGR02543 family)